MRCKHVIGWFSMKDKLWMDMLGDGVLRMDVVDGYDSMITAKATNLIYD